MQKYGYQLPMINEVYSLLMKHNKALLAACPGAGKTVMAIKLIEKYKKDFPQAQIIILAHGQKLLEKQWKSQLKLFLPSLCDSVLVTLPHSYRQIKKNMNKCDLLIIDEAHHFYWGTMVKEIISYFKPSHQLLLTGTPSQYVSEGGWFIVSITLQELLEYGSITDPIIQLVESKYKLSLKNYNQDMEIKGRVKFKKEDTDNTLDNIMNTLSLKGKTMIMCHSQNQAMQIDQYFKSRGIKTALSISYQGEGTSELHLFKTNKNIQFFIVVNRGILGFDYDELMNVIDFSGSLNSDRIFQALCRVVRVNQNSPQLKKRFIKVTNSDLADITYFVMSFVVAMSDPKYYLHSKDDINKMVIPVDPSFYEKVKKSTRTREAWPDLPVIFSFARFKSMPDEKVQTIACTSLREVKQRLYSNYNRVYGLADCKEKMERYSTRREFRRKHRENYEWLLKNGFMYLMDEKWPRNTVYNIEEILSLAKTYATKSAFREAHHGKFRFLKREKKLHLANFPLKKRRWTEKSALTLAKTYKSARQLHVNAGGCFDFLERNNLLHEAREYWKQFDNRIMWTTEKCLEVAKSFSNVRQMREKYPGAECYMRTNGKLHILKNAFDKKTYVTT